MRYFLAPLVISFLFIGHLSAQDVTWKKELPHETNGRLSVREFLLLQNGDYLITTNLTDEDPDFGNTQTIYRYSPEGELIWEKTHNFSNSPSTFFISSRGTVPWATRELTNGDLVTVGRLRQDSSEYAYFFRTNSAGDSLKLVLDSAYVGYLNLVHIDDFFYASALNKTTQKYDLIRFNGWGGERIILRNDIFSNSFISSIELLMLNSEELLFTSLALENSIQVFDLQGNLTRAKSVLGIGGLSAVSKSGIMSFDIGGDGRIVILTHELDFILDEEDKYIDLGSVVDPLGLIGTSDDGFLLCGGTTSDVFNPYYSFLVKIDNSGQIEWNYVYAPSYMSTTHLVKALEVEDGYVLIGYNEFTNRFWLIKTFKNGLFTGVSSPEASPSFSLTPYPNPCWASFRVSIPTGHNWTTLSLFDGQGRPVRELKNLRGGEELEVKTTGLSAGIYFLLLQDEDGRSLSGKVLVENN